MSQGNARVHSRCSTDGHGRPSLLQDDHIDVPLHLPAWQWAELHGAAQREGLTVPHLLYRLIAGYLDEGGIGPREAQVAEQELLLARRSNEVFALLGHELKSPLAAMTNAVELLRRTDGDVARRDWLHGMLERQAEQMRSLVDELLQLARISRGKAQLLKRPVELTQVVARVLEAVRPSVEERSHVLEVALPPASVILDADPTLLGQVLTNLLGNAVKYTNPGGRIELTAVIEESEVVIRVRDTGIGIIPEVLPHIFDTFWRGPRAVKHCPGGLGIGLALVRQIVELHGGSLSAASPGPGQGSELTVRLPLSN
jgi:signal transduction histidine kinase